MRFVGKRLLVELSLDALGNLLNELLSVQIVRALDTE